MDDAAAKALAEGFLAQLKAGAIALHPADTVPGLTCWPSQRDALARFKGRRAEQTFLFLAATKAQALGLWRPLPGRWPEALTRLWPGPLTVIFSPSAAGLALQPGDSLALRVPALPDAARWYRQVLAAQPLPSTSANTTGEPAATTWQQAVKEFKGHPDIYIPAAELPSSQSAQPSTLVRIEGPDMFTLLREGAISAATIKEALSP